MTQQDTLRVALARITEIASAANKDYENGETTLPDPRYADGRGTREQNFGCVIKSLPNRLLITGADTAKKINPANAPVFGPVASVAGQFLVAEPLRIALITSKYWGPQPRRLTVSFLESTPPDLKTRIISHMNAWTQAEGISFVGTDAVGDVRISRGAGGYWSYLGTDILHIPRNRPTMNLEGFTMSIPESEYKRVVRHETGHTLGFPHEHMRKELVARIDPEKAYTWFLETYGWDKATVDAQVLTPLDNASLLGTPADQTSIMCYQLPGSITRDGRPIIGGVDIDSTDYAFAGRIYPKRSAAQTHQVADWDPSEDIEAVA